MKRRIVLAAGFAALIGVAPCPAAAEFPVKPITLVIGFAPGGPSDVMARILTKRMEEILKQPVIVENRAGAGGGGAREPCRALSPRRLHHPAGDGILARDQRQPVQDPRLRP